MPITEIDLANRDVALQVAVGGGAESFAYKTDMIVGNLSAKPEVVLKDSDVVFVGYGVNAPEQDWNDYAGLDVKGKTVIVLVNDPGWGNQDPSLFKGRTMTYYGRWTYKFEEAARQGLPPASSCTTPTAPVTPGKWWRTAGAGRSSTCRRARIRRRA